MKTSGVRGEVHGKSHSGNDRKQRANYRSE